MFRHNLYESAMREAIRESKNNPGRYYYVNYSLYWGYFTVTPDSYETDLTAGWDNEYYAKFLNGEDVDA